MIRYLVKVNKINNELELKLKEYGDVEYTSELLNLYLIATKHQNINYIKKMKDVLSIEQEFKGLFMSLIECI